MANHNTIRFHCRVSSDPPTSSTVTWYLQRNGVRERLPLEQDGLSKNITTEIHMTTALTPAISLDFTSDRSPEATYETDIAAVQTSVATSIVSTSLKAKISTGTKGQDRNIASTQPIDISSQFADHTTSSYSSCTKTVPTPVTPAWRRKRSANIQSSILSIANDTLIIDIGANNKDAWKSVEGDYICVGNSAHGQDEKKLLIRLRGKLLFIDSPHI